MTQLSKDSISVLAAGALALSAGGASSFGRRYQRQLAPRYQVLPPLSIGPEPSDCDEAIRVSELRPATIF
jgi:hypothetical protein